MPIGYNVFMTPQELRRIRKNLSLTQEQLAERLGVTRVTIARWETGARRIPELAARLVKRIETEIRAKRGKPKRSK